MIYEERNWGDAIAEVVRTLPEERRIESFASRIAAAIRTVAIPAIDGYASLLIVRGGFQFGEFVEPLEFALYPVRIARQGELVRVDLNVPVGLSVVDKVRQLLLIELAPFIIGVGNVRVEDTPEGVVVLRENVKLT